MKPKQVVLGFWDAMRTNDFAKASEWLADDFQGHWPQSSELTTGRSNFTAINSEYPANGVWEFELNSIVCEGDTVVTDVSVTNSVLKDRVITFHTVVDGLIQKQTEFWPDPFEAPAWRSQWVQIVTNNQAISNNQLASNNKVALNNKGASNK
ncbi:nuclear transport factor 2 family protein [Vibrio cyclitrophicus]|uniref:nuclear transport factor 2 family protein n=1 Tax=Vibrio cyclitrophicus TaxID=47951 RepID=UPI000C82AAAD|nr:nuclear transport factor 2 family protein [Vibrio cyclitrophicus]PME77033.1 polyketide cyclase [Vibrio cyclitrophicus]